MSEIDRLLAEGAPPVLAILRGVTPGEVLEIGAALIETGVRMQAPRYMEWYAAFGLLITLVWLYLELLRLLAKLRDN